MRVTTLLPVQIVIKVWNVREEEGGGRKNKVGRGERRKEYNGGERRKEYNGEGGMRKELKGRQ